jgi:hypothetical protein
VDQVRVGQVENGVLIKQLFRQFSEAKELLMEIRNNGRLSGRDKAVVYGSLVTAFASVVVVVVPFLLGG